MPGINDAHIQLDVGIRSVDLPLRDADGAAVRKALADQSKDHERWLTADIDPRLLDDPGMRIAALDALQPRRAVFLTGRTGHGTFVNSVAARALGLDAGKSPPGGWPGKDKAGRFDGRVYEYAQWHPIRGLGPHPERLREVLANDGAELLKLGVTGIQNDQRRVRPSRGRAVLHAFATLCRAVLRKEDVFARAGGEAFCILLPENGIEAALATAERVSERLAGHPMRAAQPDLRITASSGVAARHAQDPAFDALFSRADRALYLAKDQGRNRCVTLAPDDTPA